MKKQEFFVGVDDAGRGPVIGPMVIGGVLTNDDGKTVFKKLNVKDSKLLLPSTREILAKEIKKIAVAYEIVKISPQEIDQAVTTPGFNLNRLEASRMGYVINQLTEKLPKDADITVYVDCPSININAWKIVLLSFVERKEMNFKVEHKCDLNHIECSAASVIAKVTRDEEIEKLKKQIKEDFGSGYPADPRTIEFLKTKLKKYENSGIFRKSWQTFKNNNSEKKQKSIVDF